MHFFACSQPSSEPVRIIRGVNSLRCNGRMKGVVFMGSSHWIAAPQRIEVVDRISIGTMIGVCSVMDAYEV